MYGLNRVPSHSTTKILWLTPVVRETSVSEQSNSLFWISKSFSYSELHYKLSSSGVKENFPWKACGIGLLKNMLYVLTIKTMRTFKGVMTRYYC